MLQGSVRPAPYSQYISDSEPETNEQSHDDSTCNADDECFDLLSDLDGDGAKEWVDEFFSHSTHASRPLLSTYLRYGVYPTRTLKGRLTRQVKRLYAHKILRCHATMVQMTMTRFTSKPKFSGY